jgi:hypothetical protein
VTDGPLPDGPLPGQIPRLHFSPRRIARPSSPGNGGFSRLLRVGGVAALAMGGAAAAAMLTGSGARKDHTSNGQENDADLSRRTDQPACPADLDKPTLLRDDSGSRSGGGAAHLADEAADRFGMLWKGPDNLTLSIRQTSRMADTFLDCQDILAGGVNAIWQEYLGCTRRTLEMSFAHVHEMARCRSPETLIASQADLTVKQVDLTLQSGLWIADLSARAASRVVHTWRKQNGPE